MSDLITAARETALSTTSTGGLVPSLIVAARREALTTLFSHFGSDRGHDVDFKASLICRFFSDDEDFDRAMYRLSAYNGSLAMRSVYERLSNPIWLLEASCHIQMT